MFSKFYAKGRLKKSAVTIKTSVRPWQFSNAKRKKNSENEIGWGK